MKPSSYWQKRFEQLKRDELLATNGSLDQTRKLYDRIEHSIEKDLAYWYGRYMKNNGGVSYADAQKALSKKELAEFRWTVEDYIEKAKTLELSPKWHKALENASIKAHVTRLESLKLQLRHHSEVLHDTLNKNLGKDLRKIYEGQYYKNLFEIQKGLGQGRLIEAIDPSFLDLVIHKPWHKDGLDFSSRVWQARDKLISTLERELTYIAIRGDSPDGAIRRISQLFGKSRSHSAMLIQTEHAAMASRAQQDAFKALDVEEFEYIATLDGKTSELCQSMDGKHFPMSEYQVGLTAPPLHPRCRSCTAPYFEDMEAPRWARDKDKKGYVIGEGVKFKDWEEEYIVSGLDGKGQEEKPEIETEKPKEKAKPKTSKKAKFKPELTWKNKEEANKALLEQANAWAEALNEDELKALDRYTGNSYRKINKFLRFGTLPTPEDEADVVSLCYNLDKSLNRYELKQGISVLRGLSTNNLVTQGLDLDDIIGKRYKDLGYVSTSLDSETAKDFAEKAAIMDKGEPIVIQFDIPEGKGRGAYVVPVAHYKGESEFLLARGLEFEFYKKIKFEKGIVLLKARLVE